MDIRVFEDDEWAGHAAALWMSWVNDRPQARMCLPTGETPRPIYRRSAPEIKLEEATIFLLDEFDLPPGSAARCDSMLERDLLSSLDQPPSLYHRLDVSAPDLDKECERFETLVDSGGLDLTLLGLGGNGHLGLNEPGAAVDSSSRVVDLASETTRGAARYQADAQPVRGLTLGMRSIMASDEVWLLVTGSHKGKILREMMTGPIGADLPASFLRDHPNATLFANRSAAAALDGSRL